MHGHAMEVLAAYNEDSMNVTVRGNAQRANVDMVSGNFFDVLGVRPQLGRALQPSDDRPERRRIGSGHQRRIVGARVWAVAGGAGADDQR